MSKNLESLKFLYPNIIDNYGDLDLKIFNVLPNELKEVVGKSKYAKDLMRDGLVNLMNFDYVDKTLKNNPEFILKLIASNEYWFTFILPKRFYQHKQSCIKAIRRNPCIIENVSREFIRKIQRSIVAKRRSGL